MRVHARVCEIGKIPMFKEAADEKKCHGRDVRYLAMRSEVTRRKMRHRKWRWHQEADADVQIVV